MMIEDMIEEGKSFWFTYHLSTVELPDHTKEVCRVAEEVEVHLEVADTTTGHTTVITETTATMAVAEVIAEREEEGPWMVTETEVIMMISVVEVLQIQIFSTMTEIEAHQEMEETEASEEVHQEMVVASATTGTMRSKESSEKAYASIAKIKVIWPRTAQKTMEVQEVMIDPVEMATKEGHTIMIVNEI